MKESDLYAPIKKFLESQGYVVKAEIKGCDVVATRDDELVVVELKTGANLKLLMQAVDRKGLTDHVYVGVPWDCATIRTDNKEFVKLLRMLCIGLLLVDTETSAVEAVVDPGPYQPRKQPAKKNRLLKEFTELVGDPNTGGSATKKGRMTVYRQRAILIARHLKQHGPTKASLVRDALGIKKARNILYGNVYGWFESLGKGMYQLSPRGERELQNWD